jgi:hypothetical protein
MIRVKGTYISSLNSRRNCGYARLDQKNKELAAYGILWDTPMAPRYSHLHLTFVL